MRRVPGVTGIGQFGSVRLPGISDLDLLLFCSDDRFDEISWISNATIDELSDGRYLFWHPVAVIPASLISTSRIFHSFEDIRALWGDVRQLTDMSGPGLELRALNVIVWNSYFWRVMMYIGRGPQGLRKLLLLLSNITQSVVNDLRLIGETDFQCEWRWRDSARAAVLAAPSAERSGLIRRFFGEALERWYVADRKLDRWWQSQQPPSLSRASGVLEIGRRDRIVFGEWGESWHRFLCRALAYGGVLSWLELPSVYLEGLSLLQSAYAPRLGAPFSCCDAKRRELKLAGVWQDAARDYRGGVEQVRAFARSTHGGEWSLFGDPFCLPFIL